MTPVHGVLVILTLNIDGMSEIDSTSMGSTEMESPNFTERPEVLQRILK